MADPALTPTSKLPHIGTNIFTHMSALAQECDAINLSQGFPEFSSDPILFELVNEGMRNGHNQYAPLAGNMLLREKIAEKTEQLYGAQYSPEHEVTVTAGGTQAIFTAIHASVREGDEVILFEPFYDSHQANVIIAGGIPRYATLHRPNAVLHPTG